MWPSLPTGDALFLFCVCLCVGAFVIFMNCLDQFDRPTDNKDGSDPWNFVPPPYLTPRRQYLVGFFFYCGTMVLIFLAISIVGPDRILKIVNGSGVSGSEFDQLLKGYSTFPILIAFIIIGVHPSLHLPSYLDFESGLRRVAHRIAYIPRNMNTIFDFMRFSEFDLSPQKVDEAWDSVGLRQLALDASDVNTIRPLLDRTVMLYVLATKLAGDGNFDGSQELVNNLSLIVFRQYSKEVEDIETNLQAVYARLANLDTQSGAERRKSILTAKKEIIKSLEFLYVIFACAITSKGMERISERLRALGFTSTFAPPPGVPWDPVLKTIFAAAFVLAAAWLIAANTFLGTTVAASYSIPTGTTEILETLATIFITHLLAIVEALRIRTRLVGAEKYFSETGKGHAVAFLTIFVKCYVFALVSYIILNIGTPFSILLYPPENAPALISAFLFNFAAWAFVPASCGVMTAYTIDRSVNRVSDKLVSGFLQAAVMAAAALLAVVFTVGSAASGGLRFFYVILYGGFGFVLAFMLPTAIREHWAALSNRLPDKIVVLRTDVLPYFHSIQQFTEWLYMRNERLNGKRPLDVLAEEAGLQQLTSFVAQTRTRVSSSAA